MNGSWIYNYAINRYSGCSCLEDLPRRLPRGFSLWQWGLEGRSLDDSGTLTLHQHHPLASSKIPYSGKFFWMVQFFCIFRMKPQDTKVKTVKMLWVEISTSSNFELVVLTRGCGNEAIAFYRHFQPPLDNLLDPNGLLPASLSPAAITRLWEYVTRWCKQSVCNAWKPTGQCGKLTLE